MRFKRIFRWFKFKWQKLTKGFSDDETWSLDYSLCVWLLPRLKRFQEFNTECIGQQNMEKDGEWHAIVDKIIRGVDFVANESYYIENLPPKEYLILEKTAMKDLELFGKYMRHLWW